MNLIGFDLEIAKSIRGGYDHDWREDMPLGISCVGLYTEPDNQLTPSFPSLYFNGDGSPEPGGMSRERLSEMVDDMLALYGAGYTFVTWNGLGFDFPVLAEESGRHEDCKMLALEHVDMMFHLFCVKGYPLGLATALDGMRLGGKTASMSGALAPIMWAGDTTRLKDRLDDEDHEFLKLDGDGLREKVLEYVHQDARVTHALAQECINRGYLHWVSRSGRDQEFELPRDNGKPVWFTVKRAMRLPEPDTSWMSDPKDREDFTDWMEEL